MSQRCMLGHSSGRPIAAVREHGDRIECIALVRWYFDLSVERIASLWTDYDYWTDEEWERMEGEEWKELESRYGIARPNSAGPASPPRTDRE